ncbi:MAG: Asp-tRNA(Asn)/Glu-tRNA(Gln) amidotransferase subunit GatA [Gammaproteobacteria bacterium]|jgi:aspartyl-tRNA(Asn)/glutamyl-tRNA(Gln) amidotransferase subunit A|uniref:Glutamyl-tRNA(Gln) amidotransferase subunit A n=2 Tax=Halomonadaceae TaxID=28256 RepID=A0A6F8U6A5_9GAMM|nr:MULTISPECIES: Asp-tRNA(Asn)/Glu-tRNA(Gln) amidotransferase subunit GatA [Halomonas]MBR9924226.1 Asp-tRNA(Asn)/Glu-tRNA(Gln) amidotransferase subunit GatA [Gammaproteobacteria bacterium]AZM96403.1 Asp-tRNA(Asn)/Glu-tRNA(Gln) amidotransferase subunit GatA [Halomonas venusta]MDW0358304.1 Asp-tRNA(Asn)/Glu-tRNA(Gln) amidotransferase subunit GatA [Halomonas venusta]MDX1713326.1 Asp-tRNA(Asn)/Glu-tRNA(Gln) amidotransferase subunit GatA [Halomonas venusta]NPT30298.1 Asp-tRNA(Asn)/Glu-tRNA(Gln) ami
MHDKTVTQLAAALKSGELSSRELTSHFLQRIEQADGTLNSFITVTAEQALNQAEAADNARAAGKAGKLTGIPFALKDIFCTQGVKTSCGSKMLDNFIAPYNATVVEKLNAAGTISLGKTNMDEFAMGSSNENSYFGAVKNPWDLSAVPGGSSGGSAAAVAAGLVPAAMGTDTGGSIRQPAAFCGITGLKPTYGRVSRYGIIAYASSLDQAGPMAKSAEDCAHLLNVIAGHDARDSTSVARGVPDYTETLNAPLSGLKIGLPKEYFGDGLDADVEKAVREAVKVYESLGATVREVSLPHTHYAIPAYYVIAPAEASSNLSRYDGVRFGHRCDAPADLIDLYTRSRAEGFGDEVKRRILIGTHTLSEGFFDAYYTKAQKVRRLIRQDFLDAFEDVDVLMGPASPTPAFDLGAKKDPVSMYLQDIYTIAVNLAGIPGISVPAGFSNGRPVGLQILGTHFAEAQLLNVAHQFQQATDWHLQRPAFAEENA